MTEYNVILNGFDGGGNYFTALDLAARSPEDAKRMALDEANRLGLQINSVEEVNIMGDGGDFLSPAIIKRYGKAYYDETGE